MFFVDRVIGLPFTVVNSPVKLSLVNTLKKPPFKSQAAFLLLHFLLKTYFNKLLLSALGGTKVTCALAKTEIKASEIAATSFVSNTNKLGFENIYTPYFLAKTQVLTNFKEASAKKGNYE
ncbi:MAG: hypothetical protein WCK56_07090 [Alcaligenaceae bacterium]